MFVLGRVGWLASSVLVHDRHGTRTRVCTKCTRQRLEYSIMALNPCGYVTGTQQSSFLQGASTRSAWYSMQALRSETTARHRYGQASGTDDRHSGTCGQRTLSQANKTGGFIVPVRSMAHETAMSATTYRPVAARMGARRALQMGVRRKCSLVALIGEHDRGEQLLLFVGFTL